MKVKVAALVAVVTGVLALTAFCCLSAAAAQGTYHFPPIIQKLVEKFNLDPAKVDELLREQQKEIKAKQQSTFEQWLDQAVKNGELTEKQKAAILAKRKEMQTKLEALRDLPAQERCEAMQQLRDEMEKWAKENGIDAKFLKFGPGGFRNPQGRFLGRHGRMGHGPNGQPPDGFGPPFGGLAPPPAEQSE